MTTFGDSPISAQQGLGCSSLGALPWYAVFKQMQGCEPFISQPNGNLTINYLDTCEAPLSPMHPAFSAGLCMLFCGNEGLDGERKAIRHAMIVENLQQLYTDIFNDWIVANEQTAEELRWRAAAIDRYLKLRLRGSQLRLWDRDGRPRPWRGPDSLRISSSGCSVKGLLSAILRYSTTSRRLNSLFRSGSSTFWHPVYSSKFTSGG
jgi:hypothetical protein